MSVLLVYNGGGLRLAYPVYRNRVVPHGVEGVGSLVDEVTGNRSGERTGVLQIR